MLDWKKSFKYYRKKDIDKPQSISLIWIIAVLENSSLAVITVMKLKLTYFQKDNVMYQLYR